jgi:regulator of protease activity HflC (stomatin/prohibitin superfamily)
MIKSKTVILSLLFQIILILTPVNVFARITPDDIYQEKRVQFQTNLEKMTDPKMKEAVWEADQTLRDINQKVCLRFQLDLDKMAAILDEEKSRENVTKTIVAYGQGNTPLDSAAYQLNYAAEALAYQKAQDYTPEFSGGNYKTSINTSSANLKYSLEALQNKILAAKTEIKKAIK